MTTILIAILFVVACVTLLAVKIIFVKGGEFPRTHISQSAAMRERGITCVESQDFAERHRRGLYDDRQAGGAQQE